MTGMQITFTKRVQKTENGVPAVDDFNNPIYEDKTITVDDCLVAPVTEPLNVREQTAMEQNKIQVRIHFPKSYSDDVGDSTFTYGGKEFKLDTDFVEFMLPNTPTRWNRYSRAEAIEV